jgi:hypothetical protein
VDENLFYKGVDKRAVHGARLSQTQAVSDLLPGNGPPSTQEQHQHSNSSQDKEQNDPDPGHPPYPFESGDSLLALTRKHNVHLYFGPDLRMFVLTT